MIKFRGKIEPEKSFYFFFFLNKFASLEYHQFRFRVSYFESSVVYEIDMQCLALVRTNNFEDRIS